MFMELSMLVLHCRQGFRQALLWRQSEILTAMKRFHTRHPLGENVSETIYVVNELSEVLMKIASLARQLPKAKIYHAVRGSYAGFIAALAATYHRGSLVYSNELISNNTIKHLWLKVFPIIGRHL